MDSGAKVREEETEPKEKIRVALESAEKIAKSLRCVLASIDYVDKHRKDFSSMPPHLIWDLTTLGLERISEMDFKIGKMTNEIRDDIARRAFSIYTGDELRRVFNSQK